MKKKILSLLLTITLIVALFPIKKNNIGITANAASTNEQTVYNYLKNTLGLNTAAACGVLGNMSVETGGSFSPTAYNSYENAWGLCQWEGGRLTNLQSRYPSTWKTIDSQLGFLKWELEGGDYAGKGTYNYLKSVNNSYEGASAAAKYFAQYFERCATSTYSTRMSRAQDTYWPRYNSIVPVEFTSDSKYSSFKGFEGYLITGSNVVAKKADLSSRAGEIYTTDTCTINDIYTNGYCSVTFPVPSGTITGYVPTSSFLVSTSSSPSLWVAKDYVNLYSSASRSTQIYRVYPDDECYIIGTSGTSTQLFMPLTKTGGYALGWVSTSEWNATPSTVETLNPGLTALSTTKYAKCYTITSGRYNVYTSSDLTTVGYEGTASSTAWTGENDEVWIIGVGINRSGVAYARIQYPVGTDRYTGYVSLHETLVPGKLNGSYRTAITKVIGFSDRSGGATNENYWVDPGEKVYLLTQQNGYSQILYPTSSGLWRIAWCSDSIYNSMFQAQTYTVTYNANGGTGAPSAQTKTRDVALTLSSTKPTRTGYSFVGWATSATATTAAYAAGSIYTTEANVTLYAVWRINQYTITYDANGGTDAPAEQTKNYGTTINLSSSVPTLSGYKFQGWSTDPSATEATYQAGSPYSGNENITLYAVWKAYTFIVIYDANGGEGSMSSSTFFVGDESQLSKNTFTKNNYEFVGWSTNPKDSNVMYSDQQCVENIVVDNDNQTITLYAIWRNTGTYVPGDINGDGNVNNKDLTRLMKYLSGEDVEVVTEALDVNGDENINNKDLTRLMKYLAGEEVEIAIN